MIGFDYKDVYVAACLRVFSSYRAGRDHERDCSECRRYIDGIDPAIAKAKERSGQ